MKTGEPIDPCVPWIRALHDLDDAWRVGSLGERHREVVRRGERVGDALRDAPRVASVRTLPVTTLPYPTKYAYAGACSVPLPFVVLTHRTLLVQLRTSDGLKNLLFNPTDYDAGLATPFFKRLAERAGEWATRRVVRGHEPLEAQLAALGLSPSDIDLIAFDHFHVQDLRPLLGTRGLPREADREGRFPNARLLARRAEWDAWDDLHPTQQAWFVRDGKRGIPEERVVLTDADVVLGEGCVLLRTPGHTPGNQTLFCHTERGVFGCSENGVCVDNWAPLAARIPGVCEVAKQQDLDLIPNANTLDLSVQYTSMALERAVVDRLSQTPAFFQMFPSSEMTPHWLAPGLRPGVVIAERDSGEVVTRSRSSSRQPSPSQHS